MHVVITGAAGFVGRALAARLLTLRDLGGRAISRLTLLDLACGGTADGDARLRLGEGDLADPVFVEGALDGVPVDLCFHLASLPGGAAEADYPRARRVNLDATQALLERFKLQAEQGGPRVRVVFASTIAVFGELTGPVDEDTLPRPRLTYGAQKLIGEIWIDDFSRRGWIDGLSLRLPGVLARPPAPTGQLSAFMSDLLRELAAGRPFVCPVSPQATTWASSLPVVVDNLLHAASVPGAALAGRRSITLPTSRFSFAELVDAVAQVHGADRRALLSYQPDARLEALFGRFPPLHTPLAEAAGFRADADLAAFVRAALGSEGA